MIHIATTCYNFNHIFQNTTQNFRIPNLWAILNLQWKYNLYIPGICGMFWNILLHFIEGTTDLATENHWQVTILKDIISQMEMSACREKISEGKQICDGGITRIKHRWPNPIYMSRSLRVNLYRYGPLTTINGITKYNGIWWNIISFYG